MNFIQKSIQRTRQAFREIARQTAIDRRKKRETEERTNAALELLIDDIHQETGLPLVEANLPIYMLYIKGILSDRAKEREETEPWDGESFL